MFTSVGVARFHVYLFFNSSKCEVLYKREKIKKLSIFELYLYEPNLKQKTKLHQQS